MKKGIAKLLALLLFGAAAISGCAVNHGHHRRGHDRDHHNYNTGYHNQYNGHYGNY